MAQLPKHTSYSAMQYQECKIVIIRLVLLLSTSLPPGQKCSRARYQMYFHPTQLYSRARSLTHHISMWCLLLSTCPSPTVAKTSGKHAADFSPTPQLLRRVHLPHSSHRTNSTEAWALRQSLTTLPVVPDPHLLCLKPGPCCFVFFPTKGKRTWVGKVNFAPFALRSVRSNT